MRTLAASTVSLILLSVSPVALAAQKKGVSAFDGVWREVEFRSVRPDSTVTSPGRQGVSIILQGHFSQIWFPPAPYAVAGANLTTPDAKAERYDRMVASAGTIELRDSTFIAHFEYAKNPAAAGTDGNPGHFRLVGDTIWLTFTGRWDKDTTKFVRGTTKYVRLK